MNNTSSRNIRGYVEGYYGRILSFGQRYELLKTLAELQLNTYCYAPKEDSLHRLNWREPYDASWCDSFSVFCRNADELGISVVAGIAPGLDFNFNKTNGDYKHLVSKALQLLKNGANEILVLWDDIDANSAIDTLDMTEGCAHAIVVNQLADTLGQAVWAVPRVYADEIENTNNYRRDFFNALESQHTVLVCGKAIVSKEITNSDLASLSGATSDDRDSPKFKHRTVLWDNMYANDYCPRRLFAGPWTGRDEIEHYLINPTGMLHTDRLLLDITVSTHQSGQVRKEWEQALQRHGVPDAFLCLAEYFHHPFFGDQTMTDKDTNPFIAAAPNLDEAIEACLWKWKSPLAREWYPFIFGLKHDLAIARNALPTDRILKTQSALLAKHLLR